jgi:pimeloyl-ACP methyl ester carboxylesterase
LLSAKHVGYAALAVFFLLLAITVIGFGYERVARAGDAQRYPPPGRMLNVGGHRLHLLCRGEGKPTVILEAGLGESALGWARVQRSLARTARVCSYDRAGMAWSDEGPAPRTAGNVAKELHALLDASGEPGPYLLVGHSIGGLFALRFGAAYPQSVAGIVLVDPTDPKAIRNAGYPWPAITQSRVQGVLAELGVLRVFGRSIVPAAVGTTPPPEVLQAVPILYGPRSQATSVAELEASLTSADEVSADEATGYLATQRLVVISAADDSADTRAEHEHLAGLSKHGTYLVARSGGHYVHYEDPDRVVDAVRALIAAG